MKVAIVCDWLLGTGGAERVVLELHKMFPDAPIYTSQYDPSPAIWYGDRWFANTDVRTTWLQKLPKSFKKFLPIFRAWTFSRLDLNKYDLVISASGAEAKFIKTKGTHVTYCHAPSHYYWSRYEEYLKNPGFGKLDFLARIGLRLLVWPMRAWDFHAAQRPDYFIANSSHTQREIQKYYGRESVVIHPPVDLDRFKNARKGPRHGFVTASRQTPYKKIGLAVAACTKANLTLTVIGTGPEHQKIVRSAGPTIKFVTDASDEEVANYFATAEAFILPGWDDFGIVAVEAMAAGTPIIAYRRGGALDYVDSETGIFFEKQTTESLIKSLEKFKTRKFDHAKIAAAASRFSAVAFQKNMKSFIAGLQGLPKSIK